MGLFGKLGLTKGFGGLMPTVKGGITLAGILPFLLKGKDEKKSVCFIISSIFNFLKFFKSCHMAVPIPFFCALETSSSIFL